MYKLQKERSTGIGWDLTVDQSAATLVGYNSQVHANQGTGLGSTINITKCCSIW
ncbi:Hep/Hag repeat protein, partial [human gut metagenome]